MNAFERVGRDLGAYQSGSETDHVGVVVSRARGARAHVVQPQPRARAAPANLVRRDGDADPGAADAEADIGLARHDTSTDRGAEGGVVDRFGRVRPEIGYGVT